MDRKASVDIVIDVRETPGQSNLVGERSQEAIVEATARLVRHLRHDVECHFTADAEVEISASVNGSVITAEAKTKEPKALYTVIYDDKDGNSSFYLLRSAHEPTQKEAVDAHHINFDAQLEHLYIESADDVIVEL